MVQLIDANYASEEDRIYSFARWPVPYISPKALAAAGFFYTGKNDIVQCFECGIKIDRWMEGDKPMAEHQRFEAFCRFTRKISCGNIPLGVDPCSIPEPRGQDIRGLYGLEYRARSSPDCICEPL